MVGSNSFFDHSEDGGSKLLRNVIDKLPVYIVIFQKTVISINKAAKNSTHTSP